MSRVFGLIIGFAVLSLIFLVIERLSPHIKGQRVLRKGFWTDVIYWFFTPLVTKVLTQVALFFPMIVLVVAAGVTVAQLKAHQYTGYGPISRQPLWLQGVELFILGDFLGYWSHRFFHTGRWWKIHAVHHSSQQLDWLSSVRVHPLNDVGTKLAQVFPILLLGFNPDIRVLGIYAPVLTFYAIFLHANVDWTYGPFRAVIASPVFHRWHHTSELEGRDKNFAGFFPLWDILFGTYYMPEGKLPREFGIDEPMPENILGQLAFPFRKEKETAVSPAPVPQPELVGK